MSNCKRLEELSLADVLSQKMNNKENFTISVQTGFGEHYKNTIYFDFNLKIVDIQEYLPNHIGRPVSRHKTSKFDRIYMNISINNDIIIKITLIPENQKETKTTLYRNIYSTGIVEKVA